MPNGLDQVNGHPGYAGAGAVPASIHQRGWMWRTGLVVTEYVPSYSDSRNRGSRSLLDSVEGATEPGGERYQRL